MILGKHDIGEQTAKMILANSRWPDLLERLIAVSRENFEFFSKTITRSVEYPFIADAIGEPLNKRILDVGAGLSPLPFFLATDGAHVATVDNSLIVRSKYENKQEWNEWGYYNYGLSNVNIASIHADILVADLPEDSFDVIYSVSVIEHLLAIERRKIWERLKRLLKRNGKLLLTLDLIPGTDSLWNYSAGHLVEDVEKHGDMVAIRDELTFNCFSLDEESYLRGDHDSRTDVALLKLTMR